MLKPILRGKSGLLFFEGKKALTKKGWHQWGDDKMLFFVAAVRQRSRLYWGDSRGGEDAIYGFRSPRVLA